MKVNRMVSFLLICCLLAFSFSYNIAATDTLPAVETEIEICSGCEEHEHEYDELIRIFEVITSVKDQEQRIVFLMRALMELNNNESLLEYEEQNKLFLTILMR